MGQLLAPPQRINIRKFGQIIATQHQIRQIRHRGRECGVDGCDAVVREEQRLDARGERKVTQDLDIVVCEVDAIVGLYGSVSTISNT